MSKKDEIIRLWTECFGDSKEYAEMYFSRVYSDDDTLSINDDKGKTASSLQIRDFSMRFAGETVGLSYLCGAATARKYRGRGYMSRLILRALDKSFSRGAMMAALIPAHEWLYFFFERFGFSNVYLTDRQNYTSFHPFTTQKTYFEVDNPYSDEVFESFCIFEREGPDGVLHSRRDFLNILDDLSLRKGGTFVVVGRDDAPIAAMAWALDRGGFIQVNELIGIDADARAGAMQALRHRYADRQMTLLAPADDNISRHLHPRGMGRIINAETALSVLARNNPDWKSMIRIHDPLLATNNHTYRIGYGECHICDTYSGNLDLDVDISVFTRIAFSSPAIGSIIGFPSARTHISLMLH